MLAGTLGLLVAGLVARAVGAPSGAVDGPWFAAGVVGALYSLAETTASLRARRLGVDVIALVALVGALATGELLAAGVVAVMVATGRALEAWAEGRARRDLRALVERAPTVAHRRVGDRIVTVAADEVEVGDVLLVATGEVVPADGDLTGPAVLDESALTGEPLPVSREAATPLRSGVTNAGPPFEMTVTVEVSESTYAHVVRLTEEAERNPAPFVRLADRYSLYFLAATAVVAAVAWGLGGASRAVAVLVVATPCPLILASPVAFASGLSRAARRGVVVKGAAVLERLARCTTLLVDKTGTITMGRPEVVGVVTGVGGDPDEVVRLAASLDQTSTHVLAAAVVREARRRDLPLEVPSAVREEAGRGAVGDVAGRRVAVGTAEWAGVTESAPAWVEVARRRVHWEGATGIYVALDGQPRGVVLVTDPVRADAAHALRVLRRHGVARVVMVTGDRREVGDLVGDLVGVDEVVAECSPEEKLDVVRAERALAPTVMVGDGINDAPALALADVGVAMGARGATASSEAADVVLTVDRLDRIGDARAIAARSRRIALQSVVVGMALSLGAMGVATAGLLPAVWGALAQEGIDVVAIANALRVLRRPRAEVSLPHRAEEAIAALRAEHGPERAALAELVEVADGLDRAGPAGFGGALADLSRRLEHDVVAHEQLEEATLYPLLARSLGGVDPTATMSRAHREIVARARRLAQLATDLEGAPLGAPDVAEVRRALYGLEAILRLHMDQEEESYFTLAESSPEEPVAPAGRR
ncbi:MAG TPA: heavy metal translocating P-type ATPase [Acidimicrobiales bacterium]|nr:heavy metal translocating P-type ATPase [Acidimicrobiales bacterium]